MKNILLLLSLLGVFLCCLVYTIIQMSSNFNSLYELGQATGFLFGRIIIIIVPILIALYLFVKFWNKKQVN